MRPHDCRVYTVSICGVTERSVVLPALVCTKLSLKGNDDFKVEVLTQLQSGALSKLHGKGKRVVFSFSRYIFILLRGTKFKLATIH